MLYLFKMFLKKYHLIKIFARKTKKSGRKMPLDLSSFVVRFYRYFRSGSYLKRFTTRKSSALFPDSYSALMLFAARLRHVAGTNWGSRRYLNMDLLREQDLNLKFELGEKI